MADWNGFKKNGTTYIPNDATARAGVIANTKLIKDTVGWSGKNKWDKSKETGIDATITQTSDGFRAQVSSHAWGSARCDFATPAKNTDFILSCKANVTTAGNFMKMQVYGSMDGSDYSTSIAVTDTYSATKELELAFNSGNYNYLRITLYLTNGTAASADVTFEKPMLRDASILDDTYEPYFSSTAFPRSEQRILGAKNLGEIILGYYVQEATTGQFKLTADANAITYIAKVEQNTDYRCKKNAYGDRFAVTGFVNYPSKTTTTTEASRLFDDSSATEHVVNTGIYNYLAFTANSTTQVAESSVKGMIYLASDPDPTYKPYAMTNKELTKKTAELYRYGSLNTNNFRIRLVTAEIDFVNGTGTFDLSNLANDFYSFALAAFQSYGSVWITSANVTNKVLTVKARNDSGPFTSDGKASIFAVVCEKL